MSQFRSVIIEADGGSRGNPGPAAYGAVLKDAETGRTIAEDGTAIGRATNNVAEYSGLIAGLKLAAEFAPEADVAVRMDSKLVVEQMSGRWQIKHPDMKPLAAEAKSLAPAGTTYTWIPRADNAHADRLANEALDGVRDGVTPAAEQAPAASMQTQTRGWSGPGGTPTTVILVRHGVTPMTAEKRFSGGLGGSNPGLSADGREQIRLTADWLAPLSEQVDAIIASPVRRTRESAQIIADSWHVALAEEPGFAEMEFGEWDGLTFLEVADQHKDAMSSWLGSLDVAPPGGESFEVVQKRVLAGLDRLLADFAGQTVVVVSHVTPIKVLVAHALKAPLEALYRMELTPASVTVLSYFSNEDDSEVHASMRLYNALPPARDGFGPAATKW